MWIRQNGLWCKTVSEGSLKAIWALGFSGSVAGFGRVPNDDIKCFHFSRRREKHEGHLNSFHSFVKYCSSFYLPSSVQSYNANLENFRTRFASNSTVLKIFVLPARTVVYFTKFDQ